MKTNLYTLGLWAENRGLVGEKETFQTGVIACISGKPMGFGIESPAGSGKTVVADLIVGDSGAPDDALIYQKRIYFKDAGSETSFFRDAEEINKKDLIVIKELQKDKTDMTVEAIKSITEGKSARRRRTDVTKKSVEEDAINPKPVLYTLAIENDTKPDAELRRRCVTMNTDVSKEQTQKVLELKAKLRFDKDAARILTDEDANKIRKNVNAIMSLKFKVANPFAPHFSKVIGSIAPDQKVRSMAEHFWNVMEGVVKLNYLEGRVQTGPGALTLIANVQDLLQTLDIYKRAFIRDVYSIPPVGDIILQGFNDAASVDKTKKGPSNASLGQYVTDVDNEAWIDVNHLRKSIKEKQNVILAKNVVNQICRQLVDAGYLEDWKDGQTIKYQVQEQYKEFETPNWDELVKEAAVLVKAKYPDQYDKWLAMQSISYQHPVTGEVITNKKADVLDTLAEDIV